MDRALEQNIIALRSIHKENHDFIRYLINMQNETNHAHITNTIDSLFEQNDTILNNLIMFLNNSTNNYSDYSRNRRRPLNSARHNVTTFPPPNIAPPHIAPPNIAPPNIAPPSAPRTTRLNNDYNVLPIQRLIQTYYMNRANELNLTGNSTGDNTLNSFFDPVDVFPSPLQLERATRIVYYRDIINPLNNSCPISLERFDDNDRVTILRHCNHIFRTDQINNWFRSNCRCPVCRYDIRSGRAATATDTSGNHIADPLATSANISLQDLSNILLTSLSQDSSLNSILMDPSNNNLLSTFYLAYH